MQDYYEVLGVDRNATEDVIKHVYRRLAQAYHPDVMPDNEAGVARLKLINAAYDTLADPDKRRRYDARLGVPPTTAAPPRPNPHSSQEESRKRAAEAKRAREAREAEERAKQARREAAREAKRQDEARKAAEQARAAQQAEWDREDRERTAQLAAEKRARDEAQQRRREAEAAEAMAKTMVTTVPKLVGMLNAVEISGFADGLQSARTDLAVASLRHIAQCRESVWARADSAAKKIKAQGTQPIGDHFRFGDTREPAVVAGSIAKKRSSNMGRSLGRLVANPTEHNLRVLGILAENPGRAGDLARVALGRR